MRLLLNISNHPISEWPPAQIQAALSLADQVVDLPVPEVDPGLGTSEVADLARSLLDGLPEGAVGAVVMGDWVLSACVVAELHQRGLPCLAPASRRSVERLADGSRRSVFQFHRFRAWPGAPPWPEERERMQVEGVGLLIDRQHLQAHRGELLAEEGELWSRVAAAIRGSSGAICRVLEFDRDVGLSRLIRLEPGHQPFWGRRPGRAFPSHLVVAERAPTRHLTVWGRWRDEGSFQVSTVHPGVPTPREIHDPGLALEDLPQSLAFWSAHALAVDGHVREDGSVRPKVESGA